MSETKTVQIQMARPGDDEYGVILKFLQAIESMVEYDFDDDDKELATDDELWRQRVEELFRKMERSASFWRVIEAGRICIKSATDPTLGHLEFKPEIRRAISCHEALLKACQSADGLLGTLNPAEFPQLTEIHEEIKTAIVKSKEPV